MRITVLGTGYVGLVAGACFSDTGNHVYCVDVNKEKIDRLNAGEVPIYEPGLNEIIRRNAAAGRLKFTTDAPAAVGESSVVFLAVGTPQSDSGAADLQYVFKAAEGVATSAKRDLIVVNKSTVPVGTADKVREILKDCAFKCEVVSNPEFLKEGTAIDDFLRPERVVIGTESEWARRVMSDLYAPFVRSGNPIMFMNNRSAELAKYACNTFLAMKISYVNELAYLSEQVEADIRDVRKVMITDSRIGRQFLYPGCGYGGSCFPKDIQALIHLGLEMGMPFELVQAVHAVNDRQKRLLFKKISTHFGGNLAGKTVALWGLSFKPRTDDMREAPSVCLIEELLQAGAKVKAYDPVARDEARRMFGDKITLVEEAYDAVRGSDVLAILTEWNEFRSPDFDRLKTDLKDSTIFDGRNLYSPESMRSTGLTYYSIGTPGPI